MKISNFLISVIIIIALILSGVLVLPKFLDPANQQIGCTMEAMACPDGSSVGRIGPSCEFAKCPELKTEVFGSPVNLAVNKKFTFNDGLTVTIKEINDSRCKPGAVCVWAGELSPLLLVIGGNIGFLEQEIRLGTVNNKKITKNGYTFKLQDATETTVFVIVSKESASARACYIGGCSSQICSLDPGIITTCEYREEYACYKNAKCERQANGQCAWTQTPELKACLASK